MPLSWGIVTAGKISHDFVNAFTSYPDKGDQVIYGVAARDKTRAAEFLARLHTPGKVYDSYEDMAKDKNIDIVYIGALNPQHYELAKFYLEHGKHVLCEKPLCMNLKQSQSLINIARQKKLFLMEAVWSRFMPSYLALEKEIASGKLGDIQFVEANFGVPIAFVDRVSKKELGGSAILDIGIYLVQFAQFIFKDEPIKITTTGELNESGVDIVETVILEYSGGRRAVLNANAKIKLWNKATVVGTKGRITLEDPFHAPDTLIHVNGAVEKFPYHKSNIEYNFSPCSSGLVHEALEVCKCIKAGLQESPRMTHKDSLIIAKIMETVRKQLGVHYEEDDEEYP